MNDFTMHLIISKWLRGQKCRHKRQTTSQKEVEAKEELDSENDFIHSSVFISSCDSFCTTCFIF